MGNARKCSYCAQFVEPEAVVCRHCWRNPENPYDADSPEGKAWASGIADRQQWQTSDGSAHISPATTFAKRVWLDFFRRGK